MNQDDVLSIKQFKQYYDTLIENNRILKETNEHYHLHFQDQIQLSQDNHQDLIEQLQHDIDVQYQEINLLTERYQKKNILCNQYTTQIQSYQDEYQYLNDEYHICIEKNQKMLNQLKIMSLYGLDVM